VHRLTEGDAVVDFVGALVRAAPIDEAVRRDILSFFDTERAYVDRRQLVLPGAFALDDEQIDALAGAADLSSELKFASDAIAPRVDDLEVPADGAHLEVSAGECVLAEVPDDRGTFEVTVKEADVKATR
jgi:hypothetical protein